MSKIASGESVQILVVDDHPVVRAGLRTHIEREPGFCVWGEAEDVGDSLELLDEAQPDLALIDLSLKTGSGLDLVKQIAERFPTIRMIVCSMHEESVYAERALRAGAMGYVHKQEAAVTLVQAMHEVLAGRYFASEPIVQSVTAGKP